MCKFDGRRRAAQLSLGSAAFSRFSPLVLRVGAACVRRGPSGELSQCETRKFAFLVMLSLPRRGLWCLPHMTMSMSMSMSMSMWCGPPLLDSRRRTERRRRQ